MLVRERLDGGGVEYEMQCPRCDGVFLVHAIQHQIKAGRETPK
jgi:uncharacterized C2H2 Zn-finger protein